MVFTFDFHTFQANKGRMVPCYVISHSNYLVTKYHHVINVFDVMTNKQVHFDWFITL